MFRARSIVTTQVSSLPLIEPLELRRMLTATLDLQWASFDRELIHHNGQPTGVPEYGIKPWHAGLAINGQGITSASLTTPSSQVLPMQLDDNGDWSAKQWFDTRDEMLAAFPDGQYILSLNGGADSVALNYVAGTEPGGVVQITSPSADAIGVPSTSTQFTWTSAVGLGDKLDLYLFDGTNLNEVYKLQNAPISQTQWTLPGSLQGSKEYVFLVGVIHEQKLLPTTTGGDAFEYFAPWHSWNNTIKFTTAGAQPAGVVLPVSGTPVGGSSTAMLYDPAVNQVAMTLTPYPGFGGEVRIAGGDLSGDGTLDLIAGTGVGAAHVKVLDGTTGQAIAGPLGSFLVYPGPGNTPEDPNSDYYRLAFKGGIFVASGDIDHDGRDDLITAADAGAGPHIKVFSGSTGQAICSFWAFDPGFQGGVRVAAGDLNGDGYDDILVGSGNGACHVKVFSGQTGAELRSYLVYPGPGNTPEDPNSDYYRLQFTGGVFVASGDVNGDGRDDLVTGADAGAGPHVKVISGSTGADLGSFFAYDQSFSGGVRVAVGDVNGDGRADVMTGTGVGASHVKAFDLMDGYNPGLLESFVAYSGSTGGVYVAGA